MSKYEFNNKIVSAKNYQEAAEKIFGQEYYKNPSGSGEIATTYTKRCKGCAIVRVYKIGDKQGRFWGVQAATPAEYKIRKVR